jgi:hypothetical protein
MAGSSLQLKQQGNFRWRRSWLGVTGVLVVAGVGGGLLTIDAEHPVLASCLIIAAVGYTLWFAGANVPGVLLWIVAAAMLSVAVWATSHGAFFPPEILLALGGFLLSLPAGAVFLVASIKNRRRCAASCAGCTLVLSTVLIFWFPGETLHTYRDRREADQDARQTILMLHRLAADIDAIRARLGRVPNDDAELVALRGKPMPPDFLYVNQGDQSYVLTGFVCQLWGRGDIFGWSVNYHGPNAVPRIRVSGF